MYVCMYVCVLCMCVCVCVCVCMYVLYVCTYPMYVCVCVCVCVYVCMYCMFASYVHIYVCVCVCVPLYLFYKILNLVTFNEISFRTHGPQAEMGYGTPGELQTEDNEILLAVHIFITIYVQLNIRTPDQKYLTN